MTDSELNTAIHFWMGRGEWHPMVNPFDDTSGKDYCQDHNDVREFLQKAESYKQTNSDFWLPFIQELEKLVSDQQSPEDLDYFLSDEIGEFLLAQPRQLAEAGAKAVGIWEVK